MRFLFLFCLFINVQAGNGMKRRHGDTACKHPVRDLPEIRLREVIAQRFGVKDDLWDHAVGPLVFEEG